MGEDKRGFGQASWASAAPRLEKLRFLLAKETLQHMRATEMCLHRKKHTIREKVVCVCVCVCFKRPFSGLVFLSDQIPWGCL